MDLRCESRLDAVTLYARGAHVRRTVELPTDMPPGDVLVLVDNLPMAADAGSFRAALEGGERQLVSVAVALEAPQGDISPSDMAQKVHDLTAAIGRQQSEIDALEHHARLLGDLQLNPRLRPNRDPDKAHGRIEQAVATSTLLQDLLAEVEARLLNLRDSVARLTRERNETELLHKQQSTQERLPAHHPRQRVAIAISGDGAAGRLTLIYTVPARWWPVYTVNLWDQARRAEWTREALVAQASGEDWNDVELALSTADLVDDMRLPQLPALRLGKSQPPPRKGFRPPPAGLEALFASYDRSLRQDAPRPAVAADDLLSYSPPPMPESAAAWPPPPEPFGAPPPQESFGAPPPAGPMAPLPAQASGTLRVDLMPTESKRMRVMPAMARVAPPSGGGAPPAPPPPPPEESADGWLDYDALVMQGPDHPRRGRLSRTVTPSIRSEAAYEMLEWNAGSHGSRYDPRLYRGAFDRLFHTTGPVQVPADGLPHRVTLEKGEAPCVSRWRTVPCTDDKVFREVEVDNPFPSGLMPGTVDVLVEGTLLLSSEVTEQTGSGGRMQVGLGVEDRLRVARNVRIEEEKGGILVEGTNLEYTVTIEVASALGLATQVEVVDRLPVTDDKNVKIKMLASTPEAETYTQSERGAAVRGGLRWLLSVPPGGRGTIEYKYRVSFAAKNELVGGSRRD